MSKQRWWSQAATSVSPGTRVEVLRYDPARRNAFRVGAFACAVALLAAAFWIGRLSTAADAASGSLGELEADIRSKADEIRALEQQVANLQAASGIETAASSQVRSELSHAQAEVDRLSREGELYRSLMDSSVRTRGLTLHQFEIRSAGKAGVFRYQVTFMQRAQKHTELAGKFSLAVKGVQKGKVVVLPLAGQPLKLLYFQVLEGEFRLPEGFIPQGVRIVAELAKGRPQRLETTKDWMVDEDAQNAPNPL